MIIWLINHYAVPPQYYPLARPSLFAKNLIKMGHDVTVIAASTVHNSDKNLIEGKENVKKFVDDGIPYVLIKCSNYQGNGIRRVINILQFAKRLPKVLKSMEQPDVIVATTFDPFTCYTGIKYAKKYRIKAIAEVADLWPEVLVVYGNISSNNPVVKVLRKIEKAIFLEADKIIFTGEGGYKYIQDQGWEDEVPKTKVDYINNGIDLEQFDENKNSYQIVDEQIEDSTYVNVIYTGAIRRVNDLGRLLDVAKNVKNPKIRFLIWGDGDQVSDLKKRLEKEGINNVFFKGKVEKKYVPYITSKASINFVHNRPTPLFKYGISFNKIFDYLAAGRPIICDFPSEYNPITMWNAGVEVSSALPTDVADKIDEMATMSAYDEKRFSEAARKAAAYYDFKILTEKLVDVIKSI